MTKLYKSTSSSHLYPHWAFRKPVVKTTFSTWDQQLPPALAHINSNFIWYCLLRNTDILLHHFISTASVSLADCCSWSPAVLLVIQGGMSEFCSGHTQSNVKQYWCLYNCPHKQPSLTDEGQYMECFLQPLHTIYSAMTLHPYTATTFMAVVAELWNSQNRVTTKIPSEQLVSWLKFSNQ